MPFRKLGESHLPDLNRRPELYESSALPTELRWRPLASGHALRSVRKYRAGSLVCPPCSIWVNKWAIWRDGRASQSNLISSLSHNYHLRQVLAGNGHCG